MHIVILLALVIVVLLVNSMVFSLFYGLGEGVFGEGKGCAGCIVFPILIVLVGSALDWF
ncbi:MAG: hypothetical protein SPJ78_09425 [Corynebacterium camporealensis]|uniref:hypothetical protein n=1 Tax=Corynebacterium camporealensis TaxID=161896 RepID=UPI002A91AD98|nr:hypothetical protein [Corynebacterium camporealensis]MDY5840911.1 hypothetical protein [Corynebacterium camporealensis]